MKIKSKFHKQLKYMKDFDKKFYEIKYTGYKQYNSLMQIKFFRTWISYRIYYTKWRAMNIMTSINYNHISLSISCTFDFAHFHVLTCLSMITHEVFSIESFYTFLFVCEVFRIRLEIIISKFEYWALIAVNQCHISCNYFVEIITPVIVTIPYKIC